MLPGSASSTAVAARTARVEALALAAGSSLGVIVVIGYFVFIPSGDPPRSAVCSRSARIPGSPFAPVAGSKYAVHEAKPFLAIDQEERDRIQQFRRRFIGRHLRVFNQPESTASWLLSLALEGAEPGVAIAALRAASAPMLSRRLRELVQAPRAWSIVTPRKD